MATWRATDGMMATPGLELAREFRAPAEIRRPLEAPPVQVPPAPVAAPEAPAPSASEFLGEQVAPVAAQEAAPIAAPEVAPATANIAELTIREAET